MAVRSVEHQHVDSGRDEGARLRLDIAVDADRRRDAQAAVGVERGVVDGGAEGAGARERADQGAVVQHRGEVEVGRDHQIEGGAGSGHVVGVDRGGGTVHEIAQQGVRQSGGETRGRDAAEDRAVRLLHDEAVAGDGREDRERLLHRRPRCRSEGAGEGDGLALHPADGGIEGLQRHVLREHVPRPPRRARAAASR